jgi:predicted small lipoprotein YifL
MRGIMISLFILLLFTTALTACGNKGPLTLPEEDKKAQQSE